MRVPNLKSRSARQRGGGKRVLQQAVKEKKIFRSSSKIWLGNPGIFILNCMVFSKFPPVASHTCVLSTKYQPLLPQENATGFTFYPLELRPLLLPHLILNL